MRRRTRAREIAIQSLYQFDVRGDEAAADVEQMIDEAASDDETRAFARRLIRGTLDMLIEADLLLGEVARNWDLKRMAIIDRNILRMAIYELYRCPDIPPKVTINEAIELGKKYSTANSGGFVNGILDRVRIDLENGNREAAADGEG